MKKSLIYARKGKLGGYVGHYGHTETCIIEGHALSSRVVWPVGKSGKSEFMTKQDALDAAREEWEHELRRNGFASETEWLAVEW